VFFERPPADRKTASAGYYNTAAFDRYELRPRVLTDVANIDLRTKILGTTLDLPFFLSPTGMSRLFHHDKELGAARAASRFGTLYSLSTMATKLRRRSVGRLVGFMFIMIRPASAFTSEKRKIWQNDSRKISSERIRRTKATNAASTLSFGRLVREA